MFLIARDGDSSESFGVYMCVCVSFQKTETRGPSAAAVDETLNKCQSLVGCSGRPTSIQAKSLKRLETPRGCFRADVRRRQCGTYPARYCCCYCCLVLTRLYARFSHTRPDLCPFIRVRLVCTAQRKADHPNGVIIESKYNLI